MKIISITNLTKQISKHLVWAISVLMTSIPVYAHNGEETASGFNGLMDGWSHWGMAGGWMWIFPLLVVTFLIVGIAALIRINNTPLLARQENNEKRG